MAWSVSTATAILKTLYPKGIGEVLAAHSADRDHPDRVMVIAQIGNVIAESERSDVVLSGCGC